MKIIGILTSGGDSPGMNAAINGILKTAFINKIKVFGIYNGFKGLYKNNIKEIIKNKKINLINIGGTFLRSSRFKEFENKNIRIKAIDNLKKKKIDSLIIIGGNGSYIGSKYLIKEGFSCICLPGTIDNDVICTDYSIGYFTALETIVEAIDRIRDTACSHKSIFIIEIMGRYCGNLTIASAIAGKCEFFIIPEINFNIKNLIYEIKLKLLKGINNIIIAITENIYNIKKLSKYIRKKIKFEVKTVVLGYIQRGGKPISYDRILGFRMGSYSIKLLIKGYNNICIGIKNNKIIFKNIIKEINKIT
ncbi:6-phosphofructokinase [Enterobacterales bacterium endosymbiont of Anomoneura mori]|uniref:ATP-dependent 6-phosphofructokinase n=1 Tax=Enterobacterales bacterium endosymbiont of Anomoneura mori TaxID=3132096 RepID=UPI00399C69FF